MKEFMGCSINISMVELERGDFKPLGEIVLVVSEPNYTVSSAGEMIRQREVSHLRFAAMERPLRSLIKSLTAYADEMKATEDRFNAAALPGKSDEVAA